MSVSESASSDQRVCKAVVFDMDGTMFDSEILYYHVGVKLLASKGHDFTEELALRIMGVPGIEAMQIVRDTLGLSETPQQLYDESQAILREMIKTELKLMPGVLNLLSLLDDRCVPKGVATSTKRDLTHHMLTEFGLFDSFQFILTRDDVKNGKPDPEIYLLAAEQLSLAPEEILVLEDSLTGTTAAKRAGCYCVAIPHELSRSLDFSHVDLVVDHVMDERVLRLAGVLP